MSFSRKALQDALRLSHEMQELGKEEHWEEITEKDAKRMDLLSACLDAGIPAEEKEFTQGILLEIQRLNDELTQLVSLQRDEVRQAMQLLQRRKEASLAYDQCPHED
jgi:hypothetical protein